MSENESGSRLRRELWEWTKALLIALALVILIRQFLFETYIVDGPSMQPNFESGDKIVVNKILFDFREPKRGEVVVFHAMKNKDYIKRVIALPGETVRVEGDNVYIDGNLLDEPYIREEVERKKKARDVYNDFDMKEMKVPEGTIFVMGDNRSDSTDSRMIGPVPYEDIVGRAAIVIWPIKHVQLIH